MWETTVGGGRGGTWEPPKVRDEMHWQARVIWLNTFGASKSHRHPVVIHQHMCWNASPSLNIVSVRVRLMHGCFSLVHAEGHCWLALQRHTHTLMSASMSCTYFSPFSCRRLSSPEEEWKLSSSCLAPLQRLNMWKIGIMIPCYHGSIWKVYCGN